VQDYLTTFDFAVHVKLSLSYRIGVEIISLLPY